MGLLILVYSSCCHSGLSAAHIEHMDWHAPFVPNQMSAHHSFFGCPKLRVHYDFSEHCIIHLPKCMIENKFVLTQWMWWISAFLKNVEVKHGLIIRDRFNLSGAEFNLHGLWSFFVTLPNTFTQERWHKVLIRGSSPYSTNTWYEHTTSTALGISYAKSYSAQVLDLEGSLSPLALALFCVRVRHY